MEATEEKKEQTSVEQPKEIKEEKAAETTEEKKETSAEAKSPEPAPQQADEGEKVSAKKLDGRRNGQVLGWKGLVKGKVKEASERREEERITAEPAPPKDEGGR